MTDQEDRREQKRRALIGAGFSRRSARILAWLDSWLLTFLIVVGLVVGAGIVIHLWPDLDSGAWQEWADANPGFFAPLEPGDAVGIVPNLHDHTGVLVVRTPTGVSVDLRLWFRFDDVKVGLVVPPDAAVAWMELDFAGDESSWERWREMARTGGIHYYEHLEPDTADSAGYRRFLERIRPLPQ